MIPDERGWINPAEGMGVRAVAKQALFAGQRSWERGSCILSLQKSLSSINRISMCLVLTKSASNRFVD